MSRPELQLIVAGDPGQLTGGYLFDARIVAELRVRGWKVTVTGLAGRFPDPDDDARRSLDAALAGLPDGARVVIDGLALGGLPDVVACHAARLDLTALIHHPLADESGLQTADRERLFASERRALALVSRVIVTSAHTARGLSRYGVSAERVRVVEPGVEPAPLATSARADVPDTGGKRLLCVATLTPRKGHDRLIEALAGLTDRDWHLDLVGSPARDPVWAQRLFTAARQCRLTERVTWHGELDGERLDELWQAADLGVLASRYEGFGMVVSEALARGLPVIATTGGALVDTLPPEAGLAVPPDDATALRTALARWLDEPALRRRLRDGARAARQRLTDWPIAGARFAEALDATPVMSTGTESS
ncbi:glycosyltransferase family 4 protein [Billgrantia gudaonensis]|uniref:Glycosyltransferase involved in cell wall bisynthesis n=1 Tax=Billgrantia gudaonensis TaxID=376427 RepID=A0A1G8ZLW8_9GAMM|nr:glycosyltransferase family 4 protein [Halomonas gudaonensis]SDK15150.1 Glycosyltransferase involved in cell wall bisynthesis [Halomonas gudaonensis]